MNGFFPHAFYLWQQHRLLLVESSQPVPEIHPDVLRGMAINEGGELHVEIQRAMLLGGSSIPNEMMNPSLQCVTRRFELLVARLDTPCVHL